MNNWKEMLIVGPYTSLTGYSEITRNFSKGLYNFGWNIKLDNLDKWANTPEVSDDFLQTAKDIELFKPQVNLMFCLPEQAKQHMRPNMRNVLYTMIECGGKLPDNWVTESKVLDLIIVPSEHSKRVWIESGVPDHKVVKCPIGINTTKYNSSAPIKPIYIEKDDAIQELSKVFKNRILILQELISRKNIWCGIRAFCRAWSEWDEDTKNETCLFLKLNSNSGNKFQDFIKKYNDIKKEFAVNPNIYIYTDFWNENHLVNYLANFTHYLSTSMGEGWDLTCAKMASMKKCIIAPKSTSYLEYLNDENAYLINCEKKSDVSINEITARIYRNAIWDVPIEDELVDIFKSKKPFESPKHSERVLKHFDIYATSSRIDTILSTFHLPHIAWKKERKDNILLYSKNKEKCGIANYTADLTKALMKVTGVASISGSGFDLLSMMEKYSIKYFVNQCQYEFLLCPERAKILFDECKRRDIKVINIMHTYSRDAIVYNDIIHKGSDLIISHNPNVPNEFKKIGYNDQKTQFMPYPCLDNVQPNILYGNTIDLEEDVKFIIGTFGFAYFHKGLHDLLYLVKHMVQSDIPVKLLMLCNTTDRDQMGYAKRVEHLIKELHLRDHVIWVKDYLEEWQVVSYLRRCSAIVLNYYDYGGFGASAAFRTTLKAKKPPIFLNKQSPFFDDIKIIGENNDKNFCFYDDINDLADIFKKSRLSDCTEFHQDFIDKYHVDKFAKDLLEKCKGI